MGNLLTRRRELILASGGSSNGFDWDYTMGLPTDYGWTRADSSGSNATETIRTDDVRIYVKNSNYGFKLYAGFENAIGELEATYALAGDYCNSMMFLSDGATYAFGVRVQHSSNYKGIYLYTASSIGSMTKVMTITKNVNYKIKLVTDGTWGYVYVDDVLKKNKVDLSTMVNTDYHTRLHYSAADTSHAGYFNLISTKVRVGSLS